MSIDDKLLRKIIEGALLASGTPLSVKKIISLFEPGEGDEPSLDFDPENKPSKEEVVAILQDIEADCKGKGYELKEIGSGWRFQVVEETAPWVSRLWEEKPARYSRALLETLSLIAYRQPITRGDIESIRGVAVSTNIIKTLMEREWVKVVGHRDVPGRPALYATTKEFLDYFNIKSLEELPSLKEIQDVDSLGKEFDFNQIEGGAEPAEDAGASAETATAEDGSIDDNELASENLHDEDKYTHEENSEENEADESERSSNVIQFDS